MKNYIEAIERISLCPNFEQGELDIDSLVSDLNLSEEMITVLKSKDSSQMESILGSQHKIVCMLVPAKDDDDNEDESEDDKSDEEQSESSSLVAVSF
ncbi:hypothetical protein [Aliikangiella sp. G2MR2-5]|uniref:hypothetical protein n=1 Tax=Aliikangiella sp. G2MR2-5 TaxID=2788943 RepID=UPI0018AB4E36|nr:hypothetical protein [Aliikangiella sp. G2MR2-5]